MMTSVAKYRAELETSREIPKIETRWYSYGVNQAHGLRRTNDDKRKAVMAALRHPKGAKLSDNQIAKHCGVSHTMVGNVRSELETSCNGCKMETRTVTRGGKTYEQITANIGRRDGTIPGSGGVKVMDAFYEADGEEVTVYEIPPVPESTVWVGIEEEEHLQ